MLHVELLPDDRGQHYGTIPKPPSSTGSVSRRTTLNSGAQRQESSLTASRGELGAGVGSHSSTTMASIPVLSPAMPPGGSGHRRDSAPQSQSIRTVPPKKSPTSKRRLLLQRLQRSKDPVHTSAGGGECKILRLIR